ncbi:MAG: type I DNA topoisomerase [Armatimonadetes bacterium]|nr:type I DNA topoisomerase [Armatimonadota bacterium]
MRKTKAKGKRTYKQEAIPPGGSLVIVESPAKTKTLKNFLGPEFRLAASMGHVRDLPARKLGIDIEKEFSPTYEVSPERKDIVQKLKAAAASADRVYMATDPDREGEAIAWHLAHALNVKDPIRIQFNEITETAVRQALQQPREINLSLVDAQQARRVMDRLVGYQLSPLLWKKSGSKNLSAGRVQSVALRLIVEREREIRAFVPEEYWNIFATLTPLTEDFPFKAELKQKGDEKIDLKTQAQTDAVLKQLEGAEYIVSSVTKKTQKRRPQPPFITSTLQQEAARKLGFSANLTMRIAQQLYEGIELGSEGAVGLITYMRTDSVRVADEAQRAAAAYIEREYGKDHLPPSKRVYKTRGGAQDAHEAVRPTDVFRTPDSVARFLSPEQKKLYEIIWKRFVASQMADAEIEVTRVDIKAGDFLFRASGSRPVFLGFMSVYVEGKDTAETTDDEQPPLPALSPDQLLKLLALEPKQSFTQPPPRYTEATLVKAMEQHGIGRPSTYASIISTIVDRKYVELKSKAFHPTPVGELVNDYLVKRFDDVVNVAFTARMEEELDQIEDGKMKWTRVVGDFYEPFKRRLNEAEGDSERLKPADEPSDLKCPECGRPMVIKSVLRMGEIERFYGCSGYPECKKTMPMEEEQAEQENAPDCPECSKKMKLRKGRYGPFWSCQDYPACKGIRKVTTGIPCPQCKTGQIRQMKSKKGKTFFSCDRYPECKFASWNKPTGEQCPNCGGYLIEMAGGRGVQCSDKGCGYKRQESAGLAEAG